MLDGRTKIKSFLKNLNNNKLLILDGAMGTELQKRGVPTRLPLWSTMGLILEPQTVEAIHSDYIKAGAQIITTNTFRTQRRTLKKASLENSFEDLNQLAINIAESAVKKSKNKVLIAASLPPLEDCYSPKLSPDDRSSRREHGEMVMALKKADLFLIESHNNIREASIAIDELFNLGFHYRRLLRIWARIY